MMRLATRGFTIRPYAPEYESGVLDLLRGSLGESGAIQRTPSLWQWKHFASPFGKSYVNLACEEEGRVVGLRAFMQWQFQWRNQPVSAVRAVDTATHQDYRRMGVFSSLTSKLVDHVKLEGVDLVFNTPNQYSMPGYLKLGWQLVGTLHPMGKVLNYPRFLAGVVRKGLNRPEQQRTPLPAFFKREEASVSSLVSHKGIESLTSLDSQWQEQHRLATVRTPEYLDWRYRQHPSFTYHALFEESQGEMTSAAIFRTNVRFGLNEIMLVELLSASPDKNSGQHLVQTLRNSVHADYVIAMCLPGSQKARLLRQCGFRPVPRYGMNFTVRALNPRLTSTVCQASNWGLSLGDLEFF